MLPKLKKIYPLSFCEIRKFETKELEKINIEKASKTIVDQENKIEKTIENEEPEKE